ncbi:AI-2E family transporter [Jannaschia formosa]|uniref:AI-2E family transporter n=1 Tax=Jannaschia formosa TaxID=2259592 RepID=UPI000E1B8CFA|nr:AI-2E family transporter [Jannaschia formosa]TFL19292.1 AI-2E family transporter [Jannaschia formosa]
MNEHGSIPFRRDGSGLDLSRTVLGLRIAVAVVLVGWALHATASVSSVVVAALFLAVVMAPLHQWVIRRTGQDWLGHLAAFLVMLVVIVLFASGLFFAVQRIASEFPPLSEMPSVGAMIPGMDASGLESGASGSESAAAGSGAGQETSQEDGEESSGLGSLLENPGGQIASRLAGFASSAALTVMQFATAAVTGLTLVIFLALIMLIDGPNWRERLAKVFGGDRADEIAGATRVASRQIQRFLLVRAGLGLVTGALYMLWLWPWGIDLLWVWGILAFLLSFVPNLGSVVSGILPAIYAFLTKDFGTAMMVGAGLFVIEQAIGNYVDPRVQGRQISISPVVILTALLLFIWIWGLPGALLSTPVLIAVVVGFARVERLRPVALLLSDARSFEGLDEAEKR